jgi:hypothetical protein
MGMMRRILLLGAALVAMAVVAACSGGSSNNGNPTATPTPTATLTPTPTPTATPTPAVGAFSLEATGWPHAGHKAFVRLLNGTTVIFCQETAAVMVGTDPNFVITSTAGVMTPGTTYNWETFADLNDDNKYTAGGSDHNWKGTILATNSTAGTLVTVPHATTQAALTWVTATGCPGT